MKKLIMTALMVFLLLAPFLLGGCGTAKPTGEGFAIYLTRNNTTPDKMEMLSHVAIADTPVISQNDIVSYTWETHEIQLTAEAYQELDEMQIPTTGVSFVVCVNKNPIYWGAFWAGYSSQSFNGVTIWLKPSLYGANTIRLDLGYPGAGFYTKDDPRGNLSVKEALEKAGKLK